MHDRRSFLQGLAAVVAAVSAKLPAPELLAVPAQPVGELEQLEPMPPPAPAPRLEQRGDIVRLPLEGLREIRIDTRRDLAEVTSYFDSDGVFMAGVSSTDVSLEYELTEPARELFVENLLGAQLVELDCCDLEVNALVRGYIVSLHPWAPERGVSIIVVNMRATEVTWS